MFLIDSKKVIYEDISTVLVHNLLTYNNIIQMICKILKIHFFRKNLKLIKTTTTQHHIKKY